MSEVRMQNGNVTTRELTIAHQEITVDEDGREADEGGKGLTAKILRVCPDLLDQILDSLDGIYEADGQS